MEDAGSCQTWQSGARLRSATRVNYLARWTGRAEYSDEARTWTEIYEESDGVHQARQALADSGMPWLSACRCLVPSRIDVHRIRDLYSCNKNWIRVEKSSFYAGMVAMLGFVIFCGLLLEALSYPRMTAQPILLPTFESKLSRSSYLMK
jgi:hypothetical protein